MCLESFSENMKFEHFYFYYLAIHAEKWTKSYIFEVLDMKYLQSAQNDSLNDKIMTFKNFLENLSLDLHFDIGFDGIRYLEQFL